MQGMVENKVQTETGPRHVMQGTYLGSRIEVVAGYDILSDSWPFHIYVHHSSGQTSRLSQVPTNYVAESLDSAFDQGFEFAVQFLTSPADAP
ncbi:hypothetical protein [Variovorax soli]|uniref:hypothetical protein n=2 Tax=Variovorax soli TaxID=376815 RepID=UPI00083920F6